MIITPHPKFKKAYQKRIKPNPKLIRQTSKRIKLFQENPDHPLLKDHALKGSKLGLRAFSVTGDIRIIYKFKSANTAIFLDIGTHNQVYH